ncbi:MAG: phosphoadenosine phosphosulfate reductase family protein [Candidatus Methanoplasma sp.]|jgi:phosphoadenosine phosphosulfate reductase|nr:phosphoadenosine phosphosulfate reductase family protein [Candidatus Methanoplasma sp.]
MTQNIAHGKVEKRWCDECGTLLLGKACSYCGSDGRAFEINSPGDIRPCMGDSIGLINDIFTESFGTDRPIEGRMMFLNKIPGEDRSDEIIVHGEVIGVIRFDIRDRVYRLELRQAGADIFAVEAKKNAVGFRNMSGHLKGKVISGADITEVKGDFSAGDPVIIKKGKKIGSGIALTDSAEAACSERAVKIKDIDQPSDRPVSPMSGVAEFVRSNRDHLEMLERNGVSDIRSFVSKKSMPVTVSFSGGKDSLAAYGIAAKALKDPTLIFIDTGLEFPETIEYVERFASDNSLNLMKASAGNAFRENVITFGPPAKDFRWCCKVCKLGPIADLISREFPCGTVTIEGNRMLESFSRSDIGFVSKNPFVPNQTNLNPVRTWSAADIWGYIWMRGLDYNPLYDRDFERIGCYLCASCLASEWMNTGRIHPDMYSDWERFLHGYAESKGLPAEYADMGFWRWKALPPKMKQIAKELDLDLRPKKAAGSGVKMMKGASLCAAGGYSMEAIIDIPHTREFSFVGDSLAVAGDVRCSSEFEIAILRTGKGGAKIFGGGQVSVTSDSMKDAERLFERSVKALIRAEMCTECGICAKGCPKKAVTIRGGFRVDQKRCSKCGKCERMCMVMHYYDKIMRQIPAADAVERKCDKG